jgi:hypothetical protein
VLKKCFKIICVGPEYSLATQARLVAALTVIHNFIRVYDPEDLPNVDDQTVGYGVDIDLGKLKSGISVEERNQATVFRNKIAQDMWQDYIKWKGGRGRRLR